MRRNADIGDYLKPIREKPYQAYLSNALQVADILDWVLKQLGAVISANYIYLSPVATIVASWIVLNERMTMMGWLGSIAILVGVVMASKDCTE